MRPQIESAHFAAQRLKHIAHCAGANDQPPALPRNLRAQIGNAPAPELPLPRRGIGQSPIVWLHDHQWQHRAMGGRLSQHRMICQPQIAFEPDQLDGHPVMRPGILSLNAKKPLAAWGQAALSQARRTCTSAMPSAASAGAMARS